MELVGGITPCLGMSGGDISERRLLGANLLAHGLEVGLQLLLEAVPLRLELFFGVLPFRPRLLPLEP
jgi:hypothetical protein